MTKIVMHAGDKLDDLPKGRPNTRDEVKAAMSLLHKLVVKQAAAYGGKDSKYIPAHVVETSLLKSIQDMVSEDCDEAGRLMDLAQRNAEDLADHLKSVNDDKGMKMLGLVLKYVGAALSQTEKDSKEK